MASLLACARYKDSLFPTDLRGVVENALRDRNDATLGSCTKLKLSDETGKDRPGLSHVRIKS